MKKTLQTLGIIILSCSIHPWVSAQTVANSGMEEWVDLGSSTCEVAMERPANWWGIDELMCNIHAMVGMAGITYTPQQQTKKSGDKCAGDFAVRLITRNYGEELGMIPGVLANGEMVINLEAAIAAFTGEGGVDDITEIFTIEGGTDVAGKQVDSLTTCVLTVGSNEDNGAVIVRAMKSTGDGLVEIGSGLGVIPTTPGVDSFQHIVVPITYSNPEETATDTVHIMFLSSYVEDTAIAITLENSIFVDEVNLHLSDPGETPSGLTTESKTYFNIFPNPAQQYLNIQNLEGFQNCSFSLYDINGRKVIEESLEMGSSQIDISNLPTGNYLYRIESSEKQLSQSDIIVIQK